jgi:superfamily II DNA or RNA helicase
MLVKAERAQVDASELARIVEAAHTEVVAAYEAVRDRQVSAELEKLSVETIGDVARPGDAADPGNAKARPGLDRLPANGYFTVADVLAAGPARLAHSVGVSEATAASLVAAAEQIRQSVRDSLQFRIELDPSDPQTTRMLQALAVWGAVRPAGEKYQSQAARLGRELAVWRPQAQAAGAGGVRRLFMAGRRKEAADEAAQQVRELVDEARASGLLRAAPDVRSVVVPSPEEVWRDFEQRSAAYYGLLAQVVDLGGDVVAAEGYLPSDIVERINALPLNTSQLSESLRLRGYQSFGARFVLVQRRVILGDEMGLGKTVQAIATMAHIAATGGIYFLVVCPASVLINWTREVAQHSTLPVVALHGGDRARATARWVDQGGVAVTTFGSLGTLVGTPVSPDLLVVDEAHYVKNPNAKRSQAVNQIAADSERVLFLTGTALENRVDEFVSLVGHLRPEIAAAMQSGAIPASDGSSGSSGSSGSDGDAEEGQDGVPGAEAFRRAVAPVYLRRNQQDVLTELPELVQVDEWEEFGAEDGAAYEAAVGEGNFMAMRRAAFAVDNPRHSAKLNRLLEIAGEAMANGRKVVVFSYFRDVLDAVCAAIGPRACGPITGSTPTLQRQRIVDEFSTRSQAGVLVCQIEAAGVGLNIQAASVVILCEPQVKPSIEAQAIARAHRMGQVRSVQVHRLLIADSVDQRMLDLLGSKAQLFDAYVRHSAIAEASHGAVDISEVQLARTIVAQEQRRLSSAA